MTGFLGQVALPQKHLNIEHYNDGSKPMATQTQWKNGRETMMISFLSTVLGCIGKRKEHLVLTQLARYLNINHEIA